MRILVTGGAGYIGSHVVRVLLEAGHEITVLDNLSHGFRAALDQRAFFAEGSTGNSAEVSALLGARAIEAVVHLAAAIDVAESVADPLKYYANNFASSLGLLAAMKTSGVQKLVFSSTAAVYGNPAASPILETFPPAPINPYGRSKWLTELAIEDCARAYGLGFVILRYFNAAGAAADASLGEDHRPETHLIPRLLTLARDGGAPAQIFGTDYPTLDGTCVRDYVHVLDLAEAHRLALEKLLPGSGAVYNLGSERGFSVREVVETCEKVTGQKLAVQEASRRAGDPAVLVASSRKIAQELGWRPRYGELRQIVEHAWKWHTAHPHGFRPAS